MQMEEIKAKSTAALLTYFRAWHAAHDASKIFDDFLAYSLLTEQERNVFDRQFATAVEIIDPARAASCPDQETALAWFMRAIAPLSLAISRARYTEDILEKAIGEGVRQYVILGAGLDTFGFRCPELAIKLRVFEENLAAALVQSSFDPRAQSFFSWLGVTYYLPREAVSATLRSIAAIAPRGSTVIYDYLDTDAFDPDRAANRVKIGMKYLQSIGEPMITGFDPSTLASDLALLDLRLQENLSPEEIEDRFFRGRTDGYHAYEHMHFARAVVG
jgi:O-methyltransferase involved in polyketide biosynthesis